MHLRKALHGAFVSKLCLTTFTQQIISQATAITCTRRYPRMRFHIGRAGGLYIAAVCERFTKLWKCGKTGMCQIETVCPFALRYLCPPCPHFGVCVCKRGDGDGRDSISDDRVWRLRVGMKRNTCTS